MNWEVRGRVDEIEGKERGKKKLKYKTLSKKIKLEEEEEYL